MITMLLVAHGSRRAASNQEIVALTAHGAAGDSDQSLLAGMDAHMTKPFTLQELRATVTSYSPDVVASDESAR